MACSPACCAHMWLAPARDNTPSVTSSLPFPHLHISPTTTSPSIPRRHHVVALHSQSAAHVAHMPSRTGSDCPRLVGLASVTSTASLEIPLWRHIPFDIDTLRYYFVLHSKSPKGARPPVTSRTLPVVGELWQQECMSANHKSHHQGLGN
jgi:hypothetical protein